MATASAANDESPLIAALPPNTDYITYLTILEYQLTSQNLHILNQILKTDDGNLAKEIGWDLLRLVLPKLNEVPIDAKECLVLIAQRGNPREVVVRIAEELEKLGRDEEEEEGNDGEDDEEDEHRQEPDDDELRTFSGEAARIHLGEMKLDGMPRSEKSEDGAAHQVQQPPDLSVRARSNECDAVAFQALLSMLSIVHPRIKTQYPSRFLATSLPAALATYRRMHITEESTEAFLACLEKLAEKQRPPLPARTSTSSQPTAQASIATPLPDPEAPSEAAEGTNVASKAEKDIIKRLLDAVLLEVLDEYVASLQGDDVQSMLWTKRLRESVEPERLIPGKPTASSIFKSQPYDGRDALMNHFASMSRSLALDIHAEVNKLVNVTESTRPAESSQDEQDEEELSEYPTSPAQIPFPTTGSLLMLAVLQFTRTDNSKALDLPTVAGLFDLVSPLSDMPRIPNAGVQDALHSLMLRSITTNTNTISSLDDTAYTRLFSALTQAFTITPDAQSRDDAHLIATKLLHLQPSQTLRLELIKQTIHCSTSSPPPPTVTTSSTSPIPLATPFTEGALKAVGVNWLKDELLLFVRSVAAAATATTTNNNPPAAVATSSTETTTPEDKPSSNNAGLNPALLSHDRALNALIFHRPSIPSSPTDTHHLPQVLGMLPYPIALLNLCTVLVSQVLPPLHSPPPPSSSPSQADGEAERQRDGLPQLRDDIKGLLETLRPWTVYLSKLLREDDGAGDHEDVQAAAADVYALEDAWGRLEDGLGRLRGGSSAAVVAAAPAAPAPAAPAPAAPAPAAPAPAAGGGGSGDGGGGVGDAGDKADDRIGDADAAKTAA